MTAICREISFQRGDEIILRRHVDTNWVEGEFQGNIGILPVNYVEVSAGEIAEWPAFFRTLLSPQHSLYSEAQPFVCGWVFVCVRTHVRACVHVRVHV